MTARMLRACEVAQAVHWFTGVPEFEQGRTARVVYARKLYWSCLRRLNFSHKEIATMALRDHSTIVAALRGCNVQPEHIDAVLKAATDRIAREVLL